MSITLPTTYTFYTEQTTCMILEFVKCQSLPNDALRLCRR